MILSVVLLASTLSQRFYLTVGPSVPIDHRHLLAVSGSDNIVPDSVVIEVGLTRFDGSGQRVLDRNYGYEAKLMPAKGQDLVKIYAKPYHVI
jgi:hypothetical protein